MTRPFSYGTILTVLSNSQNGTAYNGYYWWNVSSSGGTYTGWCAETYLQKVSTPALNSSVTPATLQTLGQGQSVMYTVTVHDGSGNPVIGAAVMISDDVQGTCPSPLPTTNSSGQATYTTTVPSGRATGIYDISFTASKSGYSDSGTVKCQVQVATASITDQQKRPHKNNLNKFYLRGNSV